MTMSLANRLTGFFLLALAVVLAGFSGTLYALARTHLYSQLNAHVAATMDTLVAAAEVEPDGLDWEPELRRLPARWQGDPPVWAIYDENGSRLDGSHDPAHRLSDYIAPGPEAEQERFHAAWDGSEWSVARRTLRHPHPEVVRDPPPGVQKSRHRTMVFVTAVPVAPVHATVRALGWTLGGTSIGLWLAAAAVGRRLTRRALSPLTSMSTAANAITAHDAGGLLPRPGTGDELESLAEAFNGLLARLHDAFERQRSFTGEASHQLRTPLTAILGQIEVALRRDRPADEYRRALESVGRQAVHMRQIVEALLFLARADVEAELPGLEVIELGGWTQQYLDSHPHDRGADVQPAAPFPEGVHVLAHPVMLAQVIGNLIDNACKYSNPGSPVTVGIGRENGDAVLSVEDTGYGISTDELGRIFDPFFRSADARRRGVGGLGLGLAVVARIVRAFGGQVGVNSVPGRGSRFTVRFPPHTGQSGSTAMGTGG